MNKVGYLVCALVTASASVAHADTLLWELNAYGTGIAQLDLTTGVVSGQESLAHQLSGIALGADGNIYGSDNVNAGLYEVNPLTGAETHIYSSGQAFWEFGSTIGGSMYGNTQTGLYRVSIAYNSSNGTWNVNETQVSPTGLPGSNLDSVSNAAPNLYVFTGGSSPYAVYSVNLSSNPGTATLLPNAPAQYSDGLFAVHGQLYAIQDSGSAGSENLYAISNTGAWSLVSNSGGFTNGQTGVNVWGVIPQTLAEETVPEPASVFVLGFVALRMRWRR